MHKPIKNNNLKNGWDQDNLAGKESEEIEKKPHSPYAPLHSPVTTSGTVTRYGID